ncbi:hypothetical protein IT570_03355 [Candidatus Sumerlaeota bacterium]|nr:hypothetical protein [Candidatus Sumerlaeota bacterium]
MSNVTTYIIQQRFLVDSGQAIRNTTTMTDALLKTAAAEQSVKAGAVGMAGAIQSAANSSTASVAAIPAMMQRAGREARDFEGKGVSAFSRVGSAAGPLLAKIGGVAAAFFGLQQSARLAMKAVGDQIDVETSALSMAALIDANFSMAGKQGGEKFAASMLLAHGYVEKLARKSAELPGEFKDFVGISGAIAGPLFAANQGLDQLLAKTASVAIMAQVIPGARPDDVGNQVSRMLQGQAGADNPVAMFLKSTSMLRMEFEQFNRLPIGERARVTFEAIDRLVGNPAFQAAIAGSSAVQFSTLKDNLTGVVGLLGYAGNRMKTGLVAEAANLNGWFERNQSKVREIGEDIADFILTPIHAISRGLQFVLDHEKDILKTAVAIGAATATWKLAALAGTAYGGGGGMYAGMMTASVVAGTAMTGGGAFLGNAARVGILGPLLLLPGLLAGLVSRSTGSAILMTAFAPIVPLFAKLGAALPVLLPGILLIVASVAAVYGAFIVIKNNILGLGAFFHNSMGQLGASFTRLGGSLGGLFMALAGPLGVVLVPLVSILAICLSKVLDLLNGAINLIGGVIAAISGFIGNLLMTGSLSKAWEEAKYSYNNFSMDKVADKFAKTSLQQNMNEQMAAAAAINNINIYGDINVQQQFERGESPNRIAFAWTDEIAKRRSRSPQIRPLKAN